VATCVQAYLQRSVHGQHYPGCAALRIAHPGSSLRDRRTNLVRERAITLFGKHRVWDTQANCGVLIYVNMVERAVEVVADRGIAPLIAEDQWRAWVLQLNQAFSQNQYQSGLVQVIDQMAPHFASALPAVDGEKAANNALADTPIVL
jgi:uncharacterized membrane protein